MTLARTVSAFVLVLTSLTSAAAQPPATTPATPDVMPTWGSLFTELPRDARHLPSKANALWLGGAGALALIVHSEDAALTRRAVASPGLDTTLEAGAFVGGGVVQVGGAFATFVLGKVSDRPRVALVGADLVRAQIINTALTQGLKVAVNRRRPDGSRFSFPSGHASSSFATAAVLQRWLGWKAGVPAVGAATYVAASRLQENRHYLSDVVFGAALGIVAGRAVTVGHGAHTFALTPLASS
ncbi:MAG: phosphatase PAP2 family protein, partial [Acidobacteriota bacterium]